LPVTQSGLLLWLPAELSFRNPDFFRPCQQRAHRTVPRASSRF